MKTAERASKFIRQFAGPKEGSNIVCFKFWQLVPAGGCPYQCAYCFLQTTTWFRCNPEYLTGLVYTNTEKMMAELKRWLADGTGKMLVVGELQDGLVFEQAYKKRTGKALTHWLVPEFAEQSNHRLLFLTKSTEIQFALELPPTDQVVFSWSVNAEYAGEQWEQGAPLPSQRIEAAKRMRDAGWPVRIRLDPMVPYPGWEEGYAAIIDEINKLEPEMVTLGALRATSPKALKAASIKNNRNASIWDYLREVRDPSGFKYRIDPVVQREMFNFALERLSARIVPALCKEDSSLWETLGMEFQGCHCLQGRECSSNEQMVILA